MDFNKEKEYIWKKIAEIATELNNTNNNLEKLQAGLPEPIKQAAQASRKTSEYRNRAQKANEQAENSEKQIAQLLETIRNSTTSITDFEKRTQIIDSDASSILESIAQNDKQVEQLTGNIEAQLERLQELISEVDALSESAQTIGELKEESETANTRIRSLLSHISDKKREIDGLYDEVFGYDEENAETEELTHFDGLVDQLRKAYKELKSQLSTLSQDSQEKQVELDENLQKIRLDHQEQFESYISQCKATYDDTLKEIRSLLPQALTAGLASAYDEKIKVEQTEQRKYESTFTKTIFALMLISLIPFGVNAYLMIQGADLVQLIKDTPYLLSTMLPLYIPVLWLAYSANKNYKLSKRLIEEYTHKGVISKTFEGLSNQINELDDQDISQELRVKLLFNIVSANHENPGKLISDYNKSDHPLMDALDKSSQLADAVTKLAKIPGFSAIARKLDDKANKIVDVETKKVETTLAAVETEKPAQQNQ
ncbi:hypothetical protein [Vibrio cortegadensis]|uniref:hypothetical protein n=1 Tax=Vibrio cortegadensis TaxID=1328770 RepID=UPI00352C0463